jgi:hypothetical protein
MYLRYETRRLTGLADDKSDLLVNHRARSACAAYIDVETVGIVTELLTDEVTFSVRYDAIFFHFFAEGIFTDIYTCKTPIPRSL